MDHQKLKALIEDKNENFLKKLKYAGLNELEYWEKRPDNLSKEIFIRYLNGIDETRQLFPNMSQRESDSGKYGKTGFKWVFKFTDKLQILGREIEVYLKGFFFEEKDPRGIEVQSFKKSVSLTVVKKDK
ncbi:MAG: hypothetical protein R3B45_18250 [Bdellovibrionota bacterium]